MTDEQGIDRILREQNGLFEDSAGEDDHLADELIARHVEQGTALSESNLAHLATCAECREVVAIALKEADGSDRSRRWVLRTVLASTAVAAAAAIGFVALTGETDGYRSRGADGDLTAEVTFLAVSADGKRRELAKGDSVAKAEQLGFRYGNPEGSHSTLTILGWDGKKVHWYYPAKLGDAAQKIDGGKKAMSIRLPFDVKLDDHDAGKLWLVAAFDTKPADLAKRLERDGPPESALQVVVR